MSIDTDVQASTSSCLFRLILLVAVVEVDLISAAVSVSTPNVDKWALSADIRFRPKAVVPHSVLSVLACCCYGKFGGCRK